MQRFLVVYHGIIRESLVFSLDSHELNASVYTTKIQVRIQVRYSMVYHERALHNYLYHAIENTMANAINATYARRIMGKLDVIPSILIGCIFYDMV